MLAGVKNALAPIVGLFAFTFPFFAEASLLQGRYVYTRHCIACHGPRGDGKGEMGLTVQPKPRDFRSGIFKYHSTPAGSLPTNEDLARTVRTGIPDTAMPSFANLPDRDIEAVIEYIKTFSSKWRKPENRAQPLMLPKPPVWFNDPPESRKHVEKGQSLFQVSCAPCHDAKSAASTNLLDAWGNLIKPRDFQRQHIRSGPLPEDIYRVLMTGIDGTPMPSFAESFTDQQRWQLAAFVFELRRAAKAKE